MSKRLCEESRDAYRRTAKEGLDRCVAQANEAPPFSPERDEMLRLGALYAAQLGTLDLEPKYTPDGFILELFEKFKKIVDLLQQAAISVAKNENTYEKLRKFYDEYREFNGLHYEKISSLVLRGLTPVYTRPPLENYQKQTDFRNDDLFLYAHQEYMDRIAQAFHAEYGLERVCVRISVHW